MQKIVSFLEQRGLKGQITSFSGNNDYPAAEAALELWNREVGVHLESEKPEKGSAIRAALIHEFKTRTRVLVSTESGAKGLNLQFCNCLVNFDLPWNPQRIEQRIGRIHRYGQKHDAVVVNFINLHNEGELRVYELLKEKLHLFEGLFGASDQVLGTVVSALDFENRVHKMLSSCRTPEERRKEFDRLGLEIDEETKRQRDRRLENARQLISGLDKDVRARLRLTADELPVAISRRDEAVLKVLEAESPVQRLEPDDQRLVFEWKGRRYHFGPPAPGPRCGEPLHLEHPILQRRRRKTLALENGASWSVPGPFPAEWRVYKVLITGLEVEERILVLGHQGHQGLETALGQAEALTEEPGAWGDDGLEPLLDQIKNEVEAEQNPRINQIKKRLDNQREDLKRFLDAEEKELRQKVKEAEKARRYARSSDEQRRARDQYNQCRGALDSLRRNREGRLREVAQKVAREQQALARKRFVTVEPNRLFRIVQKPR